MLHYKSPLPRLPSRRKYGEALRKYGESWRSVSAEPSYASMALLQHSSQFREVLRERSTWSGACTSPAAKQARAQRPPVDLPLRGNPGGGSFSDRSTPSTALSTMFNPTPELRGKHINSVHATGVLSDWCTEFPAETVEETMHIVFDEATGEFQSAQDRVRRAQTDKRTQKRQKANAQFETVAERRGILGMCGDVGLGPEARLIPDTNAEKVNTTRRGTASCGPIHSLLTERLEQKNNSIQRVLEDTGVRPKPCPAQGKNELKFELLGADEEEPSAFYFEQSDVPNPYHTGWLKWRLSCFVDRIWHSADAMAREQGGTWSCVDTTYTHSSQLNQPGNATILQGYWQKMPRYIMQVVDEGTDRPDFRPPSPLLSLAAGTVLPTTGTLPAFESTRVVPFQKHVVAHTFCSRGSCSSYRVHKRVQIGLPQHGYPGWKNRVLGEAQPDPSSRAMVIGTENLNSAHSDTHELGSHFGSHFGRDDTARLTNSSSGIRPLITHNPLPFSPKSESSSVGTRSPSVIALHGSTRSGTPSQYRTLGGPSNHPSGLESWRMPHTQVSILHILAPDSQKYTVPLNIRFFVIVERTRGFFTRIVSFPDF